MKTPNCCALHIFTVLALAVLAGNSSASAASRTWTGNSTTSNNFSNGGDWNGSTDIASGDSLTFGALGTGGWTTLNNNLAVDWTIAGMTFNSSAIAYTISGNAVTLTGNVANNNTATQTINLEMTLSGIRTFTVFAGSEMILGSRLKSTGGLTKAGAGILTLGGNNTYDGDTTVTAGILRLGDGDALPNGAANGNVIVNGSGVLDFNGNGEKMNGLSGNGTIDNMAAGATSFIVGDGDRSSTFSGVIQNTGGALSLEKLGTGTLTLGGANTFNGDTLVTAGTLALTHANALSGSTLDTGGAGTVTFSAATNNLGGLKGAGNIANGGNLLVVGANSQNTTYSGTMSGPGGLTKVGSGTLALSGNNSLTGGVTLNSGVLMADGNSGSILGAGSLALNGGELRLSGSAGVNYARPTVVGGNVTITSDRSTAGAGLGYTFGALTIGAKTLTVTGGSNATDGAAEVTFGATTLTGATLFLVQNNMLGAVSRLTLASLDNGGFTPTFDGNGLVVVDGVVSGSGGLIASSQQVHLNGANTYTGATSISQTDVYASSLNSVSGGTASSSLGAPVTVANGTISLGDGGTLNYTGSGETTDRVIHLADASSGGGIRNEGSGLLKFTSDLTASGTGAKALYLGGYANGEFAGKIVDSTEGGATGVRIVGGTWVLSGANDYSGNTTVAIGTLKLGASGVIPNGAGKGNVDVAAYFALDLNGFSETVNGLSGCGTVDNTVAGTPTLTVGDNDQTGTFAGVIKNTAGTVSLTKIGAGTLTLAGNNSYSGDTTVDAGTLKLAASNVIPGGTGKGNVAVEGTLDLNGFDQTVNGLGGNGTIDTVAGGVSSLTAGANDQSGTFGGVIRNTAGTLSLTKTGTGTLTLSGNNSYSGDTLVNAGTLALGHTNALAGSTLDTSGAGTVTFFAGTNNLGGLKGGANIANGGNLFVVGANNQSTTYNGVMTGTGGFTKTGSGILAMGGVNTYNGTTTVSSGTLKLGAANVIPSGTGKGNVAVSGTLDLNGFDAAINGLSGNGTVDNSGAGAVSLTTGGNNQGGTFSGVIGNTGGALSFTKNGTGTLALTGCNTFTGGLVLNAGTLQAGHNNALGDNANTVTVNGGTLASASSTAYTLGQALVVGGNFSLGQAAGGTGALTLSGPVDLGDSTRQITVSNTADTISGIISGAGGLTKAGNGILTLGGANTYNGTTTVSTGTLKLGAADVIPNGTGKGSVSLNGTLDLNGFDGTINGLSGCGTVNNSGAGAATLTVGNNNQGGTFTGVIRNTGGALSFIKTGTGSLTLSGANTFAGGFTMNAGTLRIGNASALGSGSSLVINGGTLAPSDNSSSYTLSQATTVGGNFTLGESANFGALTLTGPMDLGNSTRQITVANTVRAATVSGVIGGTGALAKEGNGPLTLSGNNTFSGGVILNWGILRIGNANALGTGTTFTFRHGTLTSSSSTPYTVNQAITGGGAYFTLGESGTGALTLAGPLDISTYTKITVDNAADTISGVISGGTLEKAGAGILTLGNVNNSYSGGTTVTSGTLQLGASNVIPDGNVAVTGTLDLNGFSETVNGFSGNGTVDTVAGGTSALTVGSNNGGGTFGGVIRNTAGTLSLTKTGTGVLTLTGSNAFTGGFALNAGTVLVGHANALGDNANAVTVNGGTLASSGSTAYTLAQAVTVGGNFTMGQTSNGTGALTLSGPVDLGASTRQITVDNTADTISGTVSGAGGLAKAGTGTLTLSDSNTFTGATVIHAGSLSVSSLNRVSGGLAGSGLGAPTTVAAGTISLGSGVTVGQLVYTGTGETTDRVINLSGSNFGKGSISQSGTGLLKFTSDLTISGNGSQTLYLTGSSGGTGEFAGTIGDGPGGATAVTKQGTGTWTLSGNNTFSGTMNVSAGTLVLGSANALAQSNLIVSAFNELSVTFYSGTNNIGGLSGSTTVNIGPNALSLGGNNQNASMSGIVSGNGSITKVGSGIQTFSGINSFSGGFALNEGTVLVGNNNALGANSNAVTINGGTLASIDGNPRTLAQPVTVGGDFTLGTAGSSTGTIVMNGAMDLGDVTRTITVANPTDTIAGIIRGAGGLTKAGVGTLTVSGNNTFTGDTLVSAGTLALGHTKALATSTLDTSGNGSVTFYSGTNNIGGLKGSGNLANGGNLLSVGANNQNTVYSGGMDGAGGLTKVGAGVLNLSGTNTYGGATTVGGGTLLINGSTGAGTVTVASGATLGGSGTVGGNTVISGTHSPGNSPGLQTFQSNLTYENGATVVWELNSNTIAGRGTNFDGIDVAGNLTFNGTTSLNLVFNGSGSTVDWSDSLWATDQEWLVFGVGGLTTGTLSLGTTSPDSQSMSLAAGRPGSSFSIISKGNDLYLAYTKGVSGPSTWNASAGNWDVPENWVNGTPAADSIAIISNNGTASLPAGVSGTYDNLTVGNASGETGTLEITGGTLTGNATTLGKDAGSQGTVTVSNNGTWNTGSIVVGDRGNGTLNINGAVASSLNTLILAKEAGSHGTVDISGTGTSTLGELAVGYGGTGVLNIDGGTLTHTGGTQFLGWGAGSNGTVTVSGNGSWNAPSLMIGYDGNGSLLVDGGTVNSDTAYLGVSAGTEGTVTVSGNSSWNVPSLMIGYGGNGSLFVDGGTVHSDVTYLGVLAGSEGTATVSGGTWTNSNALYLGASGNGTLLVNGGNLSGTFVVMGIDPGVTGTTTVSSGTLDLAGMPDSFGSTGAIVGYNGNGVLNITGTGSVSVLSGNGSVMLGMVGPDPDLGSAGSVGTLNIGNGGTPGTLHAAEVTGGSGTAIVNFNHNAASYTFAPALTGSLSVNHTGTGTTILTGINTCTGPITVSAGTLLVNSSTSASSTVTVAHGATFGGSGTVGGNTTISGTHTPGSSMGVQTFESNLTYEDGSTVVWELDSNTIAGRGTSFDGITVAGNLTFNGSTTLSLVFNGSASAVDWSNDLWATDQTWVFFNVGGTTLGTMTMGVLSADANGLLLAAVRPDARFSITSSGNDLLLSYTAVPEPATWALFAAGLTFAVIRHSRRRR